ncbi:cytochrome P450 78A7 [Prunus yedoensis var. nudiflora]|uniref:Cytochrome P450 78A7 n=1 Tax=Prunus yedoensis var. nudiflora TaxID=2094558 RepID=A0A314Y6P7_PRUYE|nr:cytochrome P450 78A7 [Prunus yedoensis var. nudiflora]
MNSFPNPIDPISWWMFSIEAIAHLGTENLLNGFFFLAILASFLSLTLLTWAFSRGGIAWKNGRNQMGRVSIPGPRGLPLFGSLFSLSHGLPHRTLACMASSHAATKLMAFSLGSTPAVITSDPNIAKEILTSSHFADRPIKQSAKCLMFSRAIGFAPNGSYWRLLRKIASVHLFTPKRIAAHEDGRQFDCATMLKSIHNEQTLCGVVGLRKHLQAAALNNIMGTVFGKRYDIECNNAEARELHEIVREGFELLGAFNWSDYLPWLSSFYDPFHIKNRCASLVPRVRKVVVQIIEEHRLDKFERVCDNSDFVDVMLSLDGEEKLELDDMVAVLWEMIFRGTDTTALLTEWVMAELVLNSNVQAKLRHELDLVVGKKVLTEADVAKLPFLRAVVNETLRLHPIGPLLSWARLSTSDVQLSNNMVVPANTTAMVNMWAITHDPNIWEEPLVFKPERFLKSEGGADMDVRGGDLRLAPFGAGRRVCPGKTLGLVTVSLWVAKLVHHFNWVEDVASNPVDLSEVLKLSCEMKNPLTAVAVRNEGVTFK